MPFSKIRNSRQQKRDAKAEAGLHDPAKDLESWFLEDLCEREAPVSVFLLSGIKLRGVVGGFNEHVILLNSSRPVKDTSQIVYKHAISAIVPDQQPGPRKPAWASNHGAHRERPRD